MRNSLLAIAAILSIGSLAAPAFAQGYPTYFVNPTTDNTQTVGTATTDWGTVTSGIGSTSSGLTSSYDSSMNTSQQQLTNSENNYATSITSGVAAEDQASARLSDGSDQTAVNNALAAYTAAGYPGDAEEADSRLQSCAGSAVTSCAAYQVTTTNPTTGLITTSFNTALYNLDNQYINAEMQLTNDEKAQSNLGSNLAANGQPTNPTP